MTRSTPHQRLVEHALTLLVDCESAPAENAPAARLALRQWQDASTEHAAAAEEARQLWSELAGMADNLRAHFKETGPRPSAPGLDRRARQRRSILLSAAGLFGTAALTAGGLRWYWHQPLFAASYATRTAQTLAVALLDGLDGKWGSRLDLAPRSTLDVTLYRTHREIRMNGGEVRFDIAHDPQRPFVVVTRTARIEVVGTVFTVRDRGGPIRIGVERGHVQVRVLGQDREASASADRPRIDLTAGQMLDVTQGRAPSPRYADTKAMSAWREGWLVFDNVRLGEALETINAYRHQPILSTDPRVATLRLSGRFRTDDIGELVAVLPTILPVSSRVQANGSVELTLR